MKYLVHALYASIITIASIYAHVNIVPTIYFVIIANHA